MRGWLLTAVFLMVVSGISAMEGAAQTLISASWGHDFMPNELSSSHTPGMGFDASVGVLLPSNWELALGLTVQRARQSSGCPGPATPFFGDSCRRHENSTALTELGVRTRYWFNGSPMASPANVYWGIRSGVVFAHGGTGFPLGTEIGVAVPLSSGLYALVESSTDVVFLFGDRGFADGFGTRVGLRVGVGYAF